MIGSTAYTYCYTVFHFEKKILWKLFKIWVKKCFKWRSLLKWRGNVSENFRFLDSNPIWLLLNFKIATISYPVAIAKVTIEIPYVLDHSALLLCGITYAQWACNSEFSAVTFYHLVLPNEIMLHAFEIHQTFFESCSHKKSHRQVVW